MSLASLAELNRRLIDTGQSTVDVNELGGFIPGGADDDETEEEEVIEFQGWARSDRTSFEQAVLWMQANVVLPTGSTTLVDSFLEDWARRWQEDNNYLGTDRMPTLETLLGIDEFISGAMWLPLTGTGALPSVFMSETSPTEEGAEPMEVLAVADPLEGVQFIEVKRQQIAPITRVISQLFATGEPNIAHSVKIAAEVANRVPEPLDRFLERRHLVPGQTFEGDIPDTVDDLPRITQDQLVNQLLETTTVTSGGGGGGTSRSIEFDRNDLIDQVSGLWGQWYFETAPDAQVADIVDDYITEARSFWVGKGGRLEFDTFVRDRLRSLPKYQVFFKNKSPSMSEEQHVAQFAQPIRGLGLRSGLADEHIRTALGSGAGPLDQLKRVTRTREMQVEGDFSRRLAQTISGLGAGARA